MFSKMDYVMVIVSDMNRSVEFYRDKLGFPLKFESPDWTEFQTGATTLALHGGGAAKPPSGSGGNAGTCSFGFNVENVDRTFSELSAKGVRFVMPPKTQEAEGLKLAVCMDPDGLAISFAESLHK
jgi:catechol 2,3-dioxygenase-like lactoylglutathione lyase family enzyme